MTLTGYICELLYRYNCVVVPEFGAFITKRISATLLEENQLFYPPQKRISFNQQIINNDGLLANYIAKSEAISFEKATLKIQYFVQELNIELQRNKKASLPEIGFLTISLENKLTFEPLHTTNYLLESFGLSHFKTSKIGRIEDTNLVSEELIKITPETEKKGNFILKYAAVGLLLFGISSVGVKSYKKQVAYNTTQHLEVNKKVTNYLQNASYVFEVNEVLPSVEVEVLQPKIEYYIIAGAFREQENASKKIRQLRRKGFDPIHIGQNKYGLHQIAYNTFNDKNKAINSLNIIKKNINSSAWLYTITK